ncbi:MAG TPA: protein-methionine-sulfoxide reductase catalytic subunit MsrP [Thiobacillus sp.]
MPRRLNEGLTDNDVTPPELYRSRRDFLRAAALALGGAWATRLAWSSPACEDAAGIALPEPAGETLTAMEHITGYNNYYECSTNKEAVRIIAQALSVSPWEIRIDGEVEKPLTIGIEDLLKRFGSEERIYRLRCVEGWSMVIPWNGFSLCRLLRLVQPTSQAKFVEFVSVHRPGELPGQRGGAFEWPYREGLRIDEAMHPLTFVATGLYGESLPRQNGAPLRIVVPWKYGFKSPKAITHIRLTREQPPTSWNTLAPSEYGFYANVNPDVPHPRWSQRRENRLGELQKRPTQLFNGYAEHVAALYADMDLRRHF